MQAEDMWVSLFAMVLSLAPPPPAGHPPTPDKASIFGSALLVPTPEGERARRELAVAGEIERVLHSDPSVVGVRVSLRLATPCSAVIAVTGEPHDHPRIEAAARGAARALSGCDSPPTVLISAPPPSSDKGSRGLPWPLALSLLSLGVCLGILVERLRLRVHRSADDMR